MKQFLPRLLTLLILISLFGFAIISVALLAREDTSDRVRKEVAYVIKNSDIAEDSILYRELFESFTLRAIYQLRCRIRGWSAPQMPGWLKSDKGDTLFFTHCQSRNGKLIRLYADVSTKRIWIQ